jgi:hypothetical protein
MTIAQPPVGSSPAAPFNSAIGYPPFSVATDGGAAYICHTYSPPPAPGNAPSLDGFAQVTMTAATELVLDLTTVEADDLIYVIYGAGNSTEVTSVTAAGVTFTQRFRSTAGGQDFEIWSGVASGVFSGDITITLPSELVFLTATAFGVSNFNAFDSQSGLPVNGEGTTVDLTTADALDMLVWAQIGGSFGSIPTGFTQIGSNIGVDGQNMQVAYERVSATQSAVPFTFAAGMSGFVDALAASGSTPANPIPADDPDHWCGANQ